MLGTLLMRGSLRPHLTSASPQRTAQEDSHHVEPPTPPHSDLRTLPPPRCRRRKRPKGSRADRPQHARQIRIERSLDPRTLHTCAFDAHAPNSNTFDTCPFDTHTTSSDPLDSRTLHAHALDSRTLHAHALDSRTLRAHALDSRPLDSDSLDYAHEPHELHPHAWYVDPSDPFTISSAPDDEQHPHRPPQQRIG